MLTPFANKEIIYIIVYILTVCFATQFNINLHKLALIIRLLAHFVKLF